ncbi:MAG: arginine N-succinyltransferase [Betaproteobacteria bacterium]|nr:arginine N-succinyltransferase [Betaproteobacteria bacterium]
MIIRPVRIEDTDAILALARTAGVGMTTLPDNRDLIAARVEASVKTFAGQLAREDQQWMFALEDSATGHIAGVSALMGAVGLREPFYSYRVGIVVHASRELGIFTQTPTLFLSNDHTGATELCSLYLDPAFRRDKLGALLSKSRFLFMAQFREHFSNTVIAELRGVSDEAGRSPFWESLGRHFFSMDFSQADYLTGIGRKSFVAELMPKHPLYSSFLTAEAQAVIGETHPSTRPARRLLEAEGFRFDQHVDIFDAGPTVECDLPDIDAVRNARSGSVASILDDDDALFDGTPLSLVATGGLGDYRLTLGRLVARDDGLILQAACAKALGLKSSMTAYHVALSPKDRRPA